MPSSSVNDDPAAAGYVCRQRGQLVLPGVVLQVVLMDGHHVDVVHVRSSEHEHPPAVVDRDRKGKLPDVGVRLAAERPETISLCALSGSTRGILARRDLWRRYVVRKENVTSSLVTNAWPLTLSRKGSW